MVVRYKSCLLGSTPNNPLFPKEGAAVCAESDWLLGIIPGLWLAWNEGMDKKMDITIMGYIGITVRIHFFIPS